MLEILWHSSRRDFTVETPHANEEAEGPDVSHLMSKCMPETSFARLNRNVKRFHESCLSCLQRKTGSHIGPRSSFGISVYSDPRRTVCPWVGTAGIPFGKYHLKLGCNMNTVTRLDYQILQPAKARLNSLWTKE